MVALLARQHGGRGRSVLAERTPHPPLAELRRPSAMPVLRRQAAARGTTTPGMPRAVAAAGPGLAAPPSLRAGAAPEPPQRGAAVTPRGGTAEGL